MRGSVAKKLRKKIYADKDYREREYEKTGYGNRTIVSDKTRRWYQNAKTVHGLLKKVVKKQKKENRNDESTVIEHN